MSLLLIPFPRITLSHLIKQVRKREYLKDEIYVFSKILLVLSHCYDRTSNAQLKYKIWGDQNLTVQENRDLLYIKNKYLQLNINPWDFIEHILNVYKKPFVEFIYEYVYEEPVAYRSKVTYTPAMQPQQQPQPQKKTCSKSPSPSPSRTITDNNFNMDDKDQNAINILLSLQG